MSSRPRQCQNCWRYGHTAGSCKSSTRCCNCGADHSASQCTADEVTCCLCRAAHPADYSNCPARATEVRVLEVLEKRRCSRSEAVNIVKERAYGYAGATARHTPTNEASLAKAIAMALKEVLPEVSGQMVLSVTEQVSNLLSAQTQQIVQVRLCLRRFPRSRSARSLCPRPTGVKHPRLQRCEGRTSRGTLHR